MTESFVDANHKIRWLETELNRLIVALSDTNYAKDKAEAKLWIAEEHIKNLTREKDACVDAGNRMYVRCMRLIDAIGDPCDDTDWDEVAKIKSDLGVE